MDTLAMAGGFRGGIDLYGSPVWADVREFDSITGRFNQVFGHTQQPDGKPFRARNTVCIDCRRCFYLDHEGVLRHLGNDEKAE